MRVNGLIGLGWYPSRDGERWLADGEGGVRALVRASRDFGGTARAGV